MMRMILVTLVLLLLAGCGSPDEPEPESVAIEPPAVEIDSSQVVGTWATDRDFESTIVIYEDDGKLRMLERFEDGSELDSQLFESTVNGETRYAADYGQDIGEYYVIGGDGRLQMWSDNGNYYTAPIDD